MAHPCRDDGVKNAPRKTGKGPAAADSVAFQVSVSWLSEATAKVKNILGEALWKKIVEAVGGFILYIPVESNYYRRRNQQVRLFARDHTVEETAQHFCLSPRQVKKILTSRTHTT